MAGSRTKHGEADLSDSDSDTDNWNLIIDEDGFNPEDVQSSKTTDASKYPLLAHNDSSEPFHRTEIETQSENERLSLWTDDYNSDAPIDLRVNRVKLKDNTAENTARQERRSSNAAKPNGSTDSAETSNRAKRTKLPSNVFNSYRSNMEQLQTDSNSGVDGTVPNEVRQLNGLEMKLFKKDNNGYSCNLCAETFRYYVALMFHLNTDHKFQFNYNSTSTDDKIGQNHSDSCKNDANSDLRETIEKTERKATRNTSSRRGKMATRKGRVPKKTTTMKKGANSNSIPDWLVSSNASSDLFERKPVIVAEERQTVESEKSKGKGRQINAANGVPSVLGLAGDRVNNQMKKPKSPSSINGNSDETSSKRRILTSKQNGFNKSGRANVASSNTEVNGHASGTELEGNKTDGGRTTDNTALSTNSYLEKCSENVSEDEEEGPDNGKKVPESASNNNNNNNNNTGNNSPFAFVKVEDMFEYFSVNKGLTCRRCVKCRKSYSHDTAFNTLAKHTIVCCKRFRFTCQFCNMKFQWELKLKKHLYRKHGQTEIFLCNVCSKVFVDDHTLNKHRSQCIPTEFS